MIPSFILDLIGAAEPKWLAPCRLRERGMGQTGQ